ncbi:MAG: Fic family protein [Rhodospirillales bacterium]|nr:Fic family protein [Rhodospirillales bacterium]
MNYDVLTQNKRVLDKYRPLPDALVNNLDEWFRVELTYTSNAIEGNTLTRRETALVVEKGLTVGGKSLIEHLEATNHAQALDWVKDQVDRKPQALTEDDILKIHNIILKGIDDENAGHYRNVPVRISGSSVVLPNPAKVPNLMADMQAWLRSEKKLHPVELAAEAHYRLVTIHPFVDGNGRTARLLMNMILMMEGYPPAIIRKRDRLAYIGALEKAQLGDSKQDYFKLISKAVDRSLDIYLKAINGETDTQSIEPKLMKIGEIAKAVNENNSTIRHWTKEGLLEVAETTKSGYQLYAPDMIARVEKIHKLKDQRYSLQEIKQLLEKS